MEIKTSDQHFKIPKGFDCEAYFDDYFGMMIDSSVKVQRIVIRANGPERYYLRDLPLHKSQREIGSTDQTVDFELYLRPTTDFLAAIFARAGWVEIISPRRLKEEFLEFSRSALSRLDKGDRSKP